MALLRLALFFFLAVTAQAQLYQGRNLVEARLVADTTAIVPGKPFRVGLVLQMAPTWHTYWEYSGDAGIPTSIKWDLPPGFRAGPIEWPLPEANVEPGNIEVYGYGGEVMLIQSIEPPAHLEPGEVNLRAGASWLVCADLCIPGKQDVSLSLPVAAAAEPANTDLFSKWSARLPLAGPPPFPITWSRHGDALQGSFRPGSEIGKAEFFPLPATGQDVGHPVVTGSGASGFTISITTPGDLRGVLAITDAGGTRSWMIDARSEVQTPPSPMAAAGNSPAQAGGAGLGLTLWTALLSGFLGGMILNLMPCVLPVISLKIFGFVRQAGRSRGAILAHGFAFAAGIFAWFLGLGGVIVALRSAGGAATWAFQFQNVWFNVAVAAIVLVFALNLFGVYELVLPGRATNRLAGAGSQEGWAGSFFQGVFATLLATPCTGPFLGSSLGFAFSQPPLVTMAFFACMAAGMALPYLALSAQPAWLRFLPKPGVWMERLKQFMGFPLLAALLWLLYVIGELRGTTAIVCVGAFLLMLAIACWIYGLIGNPGIRAAARGLGLAAILLLALGGGWLFLVKFFPPEDVPPTAMAPTESGGIEWQPFSKASLDALLKEGKPVFVDFTAAWCLSCKFNERTAIDTPAVREKIRQLGIVPMRADWTNANPEITAALRSFGRVGVPFYVLYPAGDPGKPILLPELLTESIVLGAFSHAR
jgi:thiol:disulfide interchange protein DsbD